MYIVYYVYNIILTCPNSSSITDVFTCTHNHDNYIKFIITITADSFLNLPWDKLYYSDFAGEIYNLKGD